jgi:hypothetical protein
VVRNDVPADPGRRVIPPAFSRTVNLNVTARTPADMAAIINRRLQQAWEASAVEPAGPLELRNWVNRLASRLIGRPLSAEEMPGIEARLARSSSAAAARRDLIRFFTDSVDYREEFNQHWGQVLAWQMLGISPSMRTNDVDMLRTREVLAEQIGNRKALDEMAYDLISAVGTTQPDDEDFNPAASYLVGLRKRFGDQELASAHVADAFLGIDAQCTRCHDSFGDSSLAEFTQQRFFEFHAFFAQLAIQRVAGSDQHFAVYNRNYLPLGREGKVQAPVIYKDVQGNEQQAFPRLDDYRPDSNGFVAKVDRRSELATQIVSSPRFRESMVDHVWGSMLNLPLSGVDGNMTAAMRDLRSEIAEQFAANRFDLDWLVSTIASCDAFAVGVASEEQLAANNPFLGNPPQFHVFYSRLENRRSAAQSLGIVANAYASGDVNEALNAGLLARVDDAAAVSRPRFIHPFVPDKDSQWATSPLISRQLDMITASRTLSPEQKIRHLVQAALGRPASDDELQQATVILENSRDQRTALQDIWWSLLNSVDYHLPLDVL